MTREDFVGVVRNAMAGLGFDQDASMVTFPIGPFLVGSDLSPIEARAREFGRQLVSWEPRTKATGTVKPEPIHVSANGYENAFDRFNNICLTNRWGDGLPLVPPTTERVEWILAGTDRHRDDVIGKILPRGGIASVETVAIALALAGARPEYLPVTLAALEGIVDPALQHDKLQATSGSPYPVVIVNGPIAAQIGLNSSFGLLGPDPAQPAGASIGRALRLLMQNVGGALPGIGTMAMYGTNRYTNAVFAEDESGLPAGWLPLCTQHHGFPPGTNAITVFFATGGSNIMRRGVGKEAAAEEATQSLERVASYLGSPSPHYTHSWADGTPGGLLMSRVVAGQLAGLGWSQDKVKRFLWKHSALSGDEVWRTGMRQWILAAPDEATIDSVVMDPWPITRTPEQLLLAVAGGHHPTHNFWMQAYSPAVIGRRIDLPERWDHLISERDIELGACRID